jgi:protein-S-isoprenylcysteine O-methyltransferase Ste14
VASAACVIAWETWLYLAPVIVPAAAIRPGARAFSAGLGLFIASIGVGLMSANWAGVAAMTLLPLAVTVWRIHTEEHALLTGLGERYRAYACDRRRLVPLIW